MYVVYVWTGWWLISLVLVLVTIKGYYYYYYYYYYFIITLALVDAPVFGVSGLTRWPSNTYAWSSVPSSRSGLQPGRAQPTRMSPPVTASNSKYQRPVFTAYVRSTRKKRILSMLSRSTTWPEHRNPSRRTQHTEHIWGPDYRIEH